jgi:hypothetical protein
MFYFYTATLCLRTAAAANRIKTITEQQSDVRQKKHKYPVMYLKNAYIPCCLNT